MGKTWGKTKWCQENCVVEGPRFERIISYFILSVKEPLMLDATKILCLQSLVHLLGSKERAGQCRPGEPGLPRASCLLWTCWMQGACPGGLLPGELLLLSDLSWDIASPGVHVSGEIKIHPTVIKFIIPCTGGCKFIFLFFWGIIGIWHYISFRCTAWRFNIFVYCEVIVTINLVSLCHHT